MSMNQTCYGIRGVSGYPDFFTYLNIRLTARFELQQRTHGTIFDTITRQTFKLVGKALPPDKTACAFESMIEPTMGRILSNLYESFAPCLSARFAVTEVGIGEVASKATEKTST